MKNFNYSLYIKKFRYISKTSIVELAITMVSIIQDVMPYVLMLQINLFFLLRIISRRKEVS